MTGAESLRQVVSSVQSIMNQATVCLAQSVKAVGLVNTGSGVVFRIDGDRIIIVTSRQVIEDMRSRSLYVGYYQSHLALGEMQPDCRVHPTADVGVLIVPRRFEQRLIPFALATSVVAQARQNMVALWLVAFPDVASPIRRTDRNQYGFLEHGHAVNVEEVSSNDERLVVARTRASSEEEQQQDLPHARETSGRALWGFIEGRKPVADARTAKRALRVVGIQSAPYDPSGERVAIIEPVERWSSWFQDTIKVVATDTAIP